MTGFLQTAVPPRCRRQVVSPRTTRPHDHHHKARTADEQTPRQRTLVPHQSGAVRDATSSIAGTPSAVTGLMNTVLNTGHDDPVGVLPHSVMTDAPTQPRQGCHCLLYTSDAADE